MKRSKPVKGRPKGSFLKWFFLIFLGLGVVVAVLGGCALYAFYLQIDRSLPSTQSLKNYHPPTVSTMYAADGTVLGEFYTERRYLVPLEEMPSHLLKSFLAAEDTRFYEHKGVDPVGIIRAMFKNMQAGEIVQGGSTITQQVVKSLLLTPERTFIRKVKEAILAYKIDNFLTKDEILYLYLTQSYLGAGAYGVEAAAQTYFGKHVNELTLAQTSLLAGLPKAPTRYSPYQNFPAARERQRYVLDRMAEVGYISQDEARRAFAEPLNLGKSRYESVKELNYFAEEVRRQVETRYGREGLYKEGLKIYTTFEPEAQKIGEKALSRGLRELDKRHQGFRGPHRFVPREEWPAFVKGLEDRNRDSADREDLMEALVTGYDAKAKGWEIELGLGPKGFMPAAEARWAQSYLQSPGKNLKPGDVIWVALLSREKDGGRWTARLDQPPEVQGAIISMAPDSGRVIAMIGGRDFEQSQFNRATQAVRQPGSSFKPIVYAAALDKGYTLASTLIDSPFVRDDHTSQGPWAPENYDHKFWGPILLRNALVHSRNVVTVKLMDDIGVNYVVNYARRLGIQSPLWPNLTLALGASAVTLPEMMTAYSVFANHGERSKPYLIEKVTDRYGNVLEEHQVQRESVMSPQTAYLMTNILQGVIEEGTGQFAKKLGRPAAGKTGTTNELKDAWFMGYTPSLLTGVWVGYDDNRKTLGDGETGGHAACPIWLYFMEAFLKDKPVEVFPVPSGIVYAKVGGSMMAFAEDRMPNQAVAKDENAQTPPTEENPATAAPASSSSSFFKSDLF